jgi:hypothetical protein
MPEVPYRNACGYRVPKLNMTPTSGAQSVALLVTPKPLLNFKYTLRPRCHCSSEMQPERGREAPQVLNRVLAEIEMAGRTLFVLD